MYIHMLTKVNQVYVRETRWIPRRCGSQYLSHVIIHVCQKLSGVENSTTIYLFVVFEPGQGGQGVAAQRDAHQLLHRAGRNDGALDVARNHWLEGRICVG